MVSYIYIFRLKRGNVETCACNKNRRCCARGRKGTVNGRDTLNIPASFPDGVVHFVDDSYHWYTRARRRIDILPVTTVKTLANRSRSDYANARITINLMTLRGRCFVVDYRLAEPHAIRSCRLYVSSRDDQN